MKALRVLAGKNARMHIAQQGLSPRDITAIPAAAGGPKGLLLKHLDQYLFADWLSTCTGNIHLIGASIGAWRVTCAASANPLLAFDTLTRLYLEEQRYTSKPCRADIDSACQSILAKLMPCIGDSVFEQQKFNLHLLTVRGIGALSSPTEGHAFGFAKATLANAGSRQYLGRYLERVVFHSGKPLHFLPPSQYQQAYEGFDGLPTRNLALNNSNIKSVLAASGAIPLLLSPQQDIDGAPAGPYWDGGISDYHIHWPWTCLGGITLYPHFAPYIVPGWLDKMLKYRRAKGAWLDNLVLLCPTDAFIRSLPNGKILDRRDFKFYGLDWRSREHDWLKSIAQAKALADDFAQFVHQPDLSKIEHLN